ncbi:MAG TPA: DUF4349 domain-containing protein [Fimbriimonadaceae bacterium]|nr:DUF4349 domain-containing protein [Fimbriimonadaceae bacterium]
MKLNHRLLLPLMAGLAISCSAGEYDQAATGAAAQADKTPVQELPAESRMRTVSQEDGRGAMNQALHQEAQQRHVIRKAELSVRVESVEEAEKKAAKYIRDIHGYVATTNSTDLASDQPTLTMSVRVPVQHFDTALATFESLGARLSKRIESEDVTRQIVDFEARLKIMKTQEGLYRGMLERTKGQTEMLEVHQRLMDLRSQIESLTAQYQALAGLAKLSTIELTLQQSAMLAAAKQDPTWAKESWASATTTLGNILRTGGAFGIWLLVLAPIWIPIVLVIRAALKAARSPAPQSTAR